MKESQGPAAHPWRALAEMPELRVRVELLDADTWGYYDAERHIIYLDSRLTQAERRCTLSHETLHALRGDEPCPTDWHEAKQERLVEDQAARGLVDLPDLADALTWSADEFEVADALWVDVPTLRARVAGLTTAERRYLRRRMAAKGEVA